tara:strand:+ start:5678 stop:6538 length:861 start_codon:yes stop_codon:yes gene_type:complete
MRFLIFGGNGFLGNHLYHFIKKKFHVKIVTRRKGNGIYLKYYNLKNLKNIICKETPDIIINSVALTNVDKCEVKKKLAYDTNVKITKLISNAITSLVYKKPFLIHISSDQVYSGLGPHSEKKPKPINYYSKTKLLSEKFINLKEGCVLRTNFLGYSRNHGGLNHWIINTVKRNSKIYGFKNIYFSPLSLNTLSRIIIMISKKKIGGVYNLGSVGGVSKGNYIKKFLNIKFKNYRHFKMINYHKKSNKKLIALRPLDMRLNCKKIMAKYKIKLPKTTFEVNKIIKNF